MFNGRFSSIAQTVVQIWKSTKAGTSPLFSALFDGHAKTILMSLITFNGRFSSTRENHGSVLSVIQLFGSTYLPFASFHGSIITVSAYPQL